MASLPLWYWCCCFRLNTKEVFFFQHLNFLFSKPVFVISYPFLLFSRLASFWAITITSVLNSLSTSLTILSSFLIATYLLWLDANTPLLWKKIYIYIYISSTWILESKAPYKKERKKKDIKINHSIVHTLNTNYYLKYL